MKCEQITIASQFTANKAYAYMGGLKFGSNPQEADKCLNFTGTQTVQPANSYQSGGGNCACNSGFQYNNLSGNSASCNYVPQDINVTIPCNQQLYSIAILCPSGKKIISTNNLEALPTGACMSDAMLVFTESSVYGMSSGGCPAYVCGTITCR